MIITLKHVRACGFCIKGVKEYCINANIDYYEFIHYGIDSKDLPDDENSRHILIVAKKMEQEDGRK